MFGGCDVLEDMTPTDAPALTVYSTTWCGYCRRLKTQLDQNGIPYAEIDIESDPAAAEFVGSVNNGNHVCHRQVRRRQHRDQPVARRGPARSGL